MNLDPLTPSAGVIFVGLWTPTLYLIGESLERRERQRGGRRRRRRWR